MSVMNQANYPEKLMTELLKRDVQKERKLKREREEES